MGEWSPPGATRLVSLTRVRPGARCRPISGGELEGVNTQARRLKKADAMVRDAIALFLDVPADSFDIKIEPILPRDLQKRWDAREKCG